MNLLLLKDTLPLLHGAGLPLTLLALFRLSTPSQFLILDHHPFLKETLLVFTL